MQKALIKIASYPVKKSIPLLLFTLSIVITGCRLNTEGPPLLSLTASPEASTSDVLTTTDQPLVTESPDGSSLLDFRIIEQNGGRVSDIAVDDNLVYMGIGSKLHALDVSDANEIKLISSSKPLPGLITSFLLQGKTAYVGTKSHLIILDISNLQDSVVLAEMELPGSVNQMTLSGHNLALGLTTPEMNGAVTLVDISHSSDPILFSNTYLPYPVDSITWSGNSLYAGSQSSNSLFILDSEGGNTYTEFADFSASPYHFNQGASLAGYGNTLLASGDYHLSLWDISEPMNPMRMWESESFTGVAYDPLYYQGRFYYLVEYGDAGIYRSSLATIDSPVELSDERDSLSATSSLAVGNMLLQADRGLMIYDLTSGEEMPCIGSFPVETVHDFSFFGNNIAVLSSSDQFLYTSSAVDILSIPDLESLAGSQLEIICEDCRAIPGLIATDGEDIYAGLWEDGLRILSFDERNDLVTGISLSSQNGFDHLWIDDIVMQDSMIAIAGTFENGNFMVINVESLTSSSANLAGYDHKLTSSSEALIAVSNSDEGIVIHSLPPLASQPNQPERTQTISTITNMETVLLHDNILFIGTDDGLYLLEKTDDLSFSLMEKLDLASGVFDMGLYGEILLATSANWEGEGRLYIIDLTGEESPTIQGVISIPIGRVKLEIKNDYILIGNEEMGIQLLGIQ